jgi:molybdopterin-guanine dinucleotide biosynthesis protein MobB
MIDFPLPVLGFAAFSGTGKTTLLSKLLPLLKAQGLHIGIVKHTHHKFDIDHPHKDSYILRKAGAEQIAIASSKRTAIIIEHQDQRKEPSLIEALQGLEADKLDMVLVEGFKQETYPKIELHRKALQRPYLYLNDPEIIAVASDSPLLKISSSMDFPVRLDINNPQQITKFILSFHRDA